MIIGNAISPLKQFEFASGAPSSTLNTGIVGFWTGDDTPNDGVGSNNGTLINGATYAAGKINNAFSLDGVNDYVQFNDTGWNLTGDFSVSFWVKYIAGFSNNAPVSCYNDSNVKGWVFITISGKMQFGMGSGALVRATSTTTMVAGTWYHVVGTRQGSTEHKIYVNGIQEGVNVSATEPLYTNQKSLVGAAFGGGSTYYLNTKGYVDAVGIWNRLLTTDEIAELYNSGNGVQYLF